MSESELKPSEMDESANQSAEQEAGQDEPSLAELQVRLEEALAKADDNWQKFLRATAELDNARKRAVRDISQARKFAVDRFAAEVLAVKDSIEMGLGAVNDQGTLEAYRDGMEATLKQLNQVFGNFEITELDPSKGEAFNPDQQEALTMQPSNEIQANHVLAVVQKGYMLHDRLLRPARVIVASGPVQEESSSEDQ